MEQEVARLGDKPVTPRQPQAPRTMSGMARYREQYARYAEQRERSSSWQRRRDRLDALQQLRVLVESSERNLISSSVEGLDGAEMPPNLSRILIDAPNRYSDLGYTAQVEFNLKRPEESDYSIAGRDAQIVNGVAKTLDDKLRENRISNIPAHDIRTMAVVAIFFSLMVAWLVTRIMQVNSPLGLAVMFPISFVLALTVVWPATSSLLKWLFPYFEYAGDKSLCKREVGKAVLLFVAGSLFVSFMYDLIRRLFTF